MIIIENVVEKLIYNESNDLEFRSTMKYAGKLLTEGINYNSDKKGLKFKLSYDNRDRVEIKTYISLEDNLILGVDHYIYNDKDKLAQIKSISFNYDEGDNRALSNVCR
ncbi:MAG: hypothetical protein U5K79_17260 [Cyclobacteriaceae bacterium]|nr:hypothetical protein [Cyclobacteriaceae bacterium]